LRRLRGQRGSRGRGFFFASRRRHTRSKRDWSSDVCSSDLSPCAGPDGGDRAGLPAPGHPGHPPLHPLLERGQLKKAQKRARGSLDRKSTRLNSSHVSISYAVFCLKKKKKRKSVYYK